MISVHMTTARRLQSGRTPKAVESVLAQTYKDFEFIICDDASEDGTQEYLETVAARDPRVKVFRNERNVNSVSISLGRCLKLTDPRAEHITWMFDDNELDPRALEVLDESLAREPDLDMVFGIGRCHLRGSGIMRVGAYTEQHIRENVEHNSTLVPNAAILVKKDVFDRFGWYDSSVILRRSCDWDLFKRIIKGGARFKAIDQELVDEYGELETDSLRNSFTTTFPIMDKFCKLRDKAGWNVSVDAALYHPIDRIPPGDWSSDELALLYHMFIEYYISVGHVQKAFHFAERLDGLVPGRRFYLERLGRHAKEAPPTEAKGLMGLYSGLVNARYESRCQQERFEIERGDHAAQMAELRHRIATLEDQLRAPRYRIADKLNSMLKKATPLHGLARTSFRVTKTLAKGRAR